MHQRENTKQSMISMLPPRSFPALCKWPRGKATDPLMNAKGRVTLLLQLGRKSHVHAPTRDEDWFPWAME